MTIKEIQTKYELKDVDFWLHPPSGKYILKHDAVEKIQAIEKIEMVSRVVDNSEPDLVRYWITMAMKDETDKLITIQSCGEADRKNCTSKYLGCMAEKRGIDRCVLKILDFYQHGIASEVEADEYTNKLTIVTTDPHNNPQPGVTNSGIIGELLDYNCPIKGCQGKIKDYLVAGQNYINPKTGKKFPSYKCEHNNLTNKTCNWYSYETSPEDANIVKLETAPRPEGNNKPDEDVEKLPF